LSTSLFERPRRAPPRSLYEIVSATITRWRYTALDADEMLNWGHHTMALFDKKQYDANALGDGPVEQQYIEKMRTVARGIDHHFNGMSMPGRKKTIGFVLMVFPFDRPDGRCNYMSNAQRDEVLLLLKEQVKRFEEQAQQAAYDAHKAVTPNDPVFER
jgi:hypothetical protein